MTAAMRKLLAAGLGLALSVLAVQAHAQGYSRTAQRVLAEARQAAGGAAWNRLRGWHEVGRRGDQRYEAWLDPLRYGMRVETREPAGLAVHGFNGLGDWRIAASGAVTGIDVTRTVSQARTEAFYDVHGYFYPGRFDARGESLGVRRAQGRAFEVVMVKPWGAEPRELWFDAKTHLLARMVDRSGGRPVAISFSDYRKVGAVRVAFRMTEEDGGMVRELQSLDFTPIDRGRFSLPRLN
ncbi:MAG: hypothetical protein JWP49_2858 [Phenylobacterium sp.]|jgi:hypothetical protein|nr:hypothetical protein [Phenylobacterium sp.]